MSKCQRRISRGGTCWHQQPEHPRWRLGQTGPGDQGWGQACSRQGAAGDPRPQGETRNNPAPQEELAKEPVGRVLGLGAEETTSIFPTVIATSSPPSKPVTRIHTQTKLGRKRNSTRSWADGAHNQQPVKLQTHFRRQIQATHKEFPQVQLPRDWVHRQKSHIHTKAGKQNTTYKNQWKHRQKN